jgi:hypothetical protein
VIHLYILGQPRPAAGCTALRLKGRTRRPEIARAGTGHFSNTALISPLLNRLWYLYTGENPPLKQKISEIQIF